MKDTIEYTKSYKNYDYTEWCKEKLFGVSKRYCLRLCTRNKLPGTDKWPADNPIWDCYIAGSLSPRVAWSKREYLKKAIDNLFWITKKSIRTNKYPEFVQRIKKSFKSDAGIMKEIQARFTIAKIAPKVTALMESKFLSIIEESKVDISCGIYLELLVLVVVKNILIVF